MPKQDIIISGINLFEGGPLSIIKDYLSYLNNSPYYEEYNLVALVHKKKLFNQIELNNIEFIEFPKSRKSYLFRLYYEYIYFKKIATKRNVIFWLSLHDITPNIGKVNQAVYCHNPSPFNTVNVRDIYIQPTQFLFRFFYKYLYKINLKKNKYIIVQQAWMKGKFESMYQFNGDQIITAPPEIPEINSSYLENNQCSDTKKVSSELKFFFPTFPRPFKNIEVICEAVKLVVKKNSTPFRVYITIDGSENKYAKIIVDKYRHIEHVQFIGLLSREEVYRYYSICDVLIFPSKLETWGLPLSEFKQFKKPIFVSDLPFARENIGNYPMVNFFDPDDAGQLAQLITGSIDKKLIFDKTEATQYEKPHVHSWNELMAILLN